MGYNTGGTFISANISANSPTSIFSITLSVGAWILLGGSRFGSVSYASLCISQTNNTDDLNSASVIQGTGGINLQVNRYIIITSGSQTWYLVASSGGAQTLVSNSFTATRIG